MIDKYNIRTDLALEQKERFDSDDVEVQGVKVQESYNKERELKITKVEICTEKGAKIMKKPVGCYITLEAPNLAIPDEDYHREISEELAGLLEELLGKEEKECSVLIIGLGNRKVTPDALGPQVVDHLVVTRHVAKEYGKYGFDGENVHAVSALVPGVMGQTGMESVEIVKGIVNETKPDIVIAVDALAARNTKRLNRTIQITNTGIHPGSGVGNHRAALTEQTLGIPVIAIGVPTVVDAATIVNDAMEQLLQALETSEMLKGVGVVLQGYHATEKYELIKELIAPHLNGMFVTTKDMDDTIQKISYTISEALNMLLVNGTCE